MKMILVMALALMLGHVDSTMDRLWKKYEKAYSSDLPSEARSAAAEIMDLAEKEGLEWDFYKGGKSWCDAVSDINWKESDSAMAAFVERACRMDSPLLDLALARDDLMAYRPDFGPDFGQDPRLDEEWFRTKVEGRRSSLEASCTRKFYEDQEVGLSMLPDYVAQEVDNDYDYLLWCLAYSDCDAVEGAVAGEAMSLLSARMEGQYPAGAWMEYQAVSDRWKKILSRRIGWPEAGTEQAQLLDSLRAELRRFRDVNSGRGVGLLAWSDLIMMEFREKTSRLDGGEVQNVDFRPLREECSRFETDRKNFLRSERVLASSISDIENLITTLDSKSLEISMDGESLSVSFRNLSSARVSLLKGGRDGSIIFDTEIYNPVRSYYAEDVVDCVIPWAGLSLDDGRYCVKAESADFQDYAEVDIRSLSLAHRTASDGCGIYVADAGSGRPVDTVDVIVRYKGDTVARLGSFAMSGFTSIRDRLAETFPGIGSRNKPYSLECNMVRDGRLLKSGEVMIYDFLPAGGGDADEAEEGLSAVLLTDRSAYNPLEEVQYKAIVYRENGRCEREVVAEGCRLKVELVDPEENVVGVDKLCANEFGAVAGSFSIPEGRRGGIWSLRVTYGGEEIGSRSLRVDEFVLPTFDLEFDEDPQLWFSGDEVRVSGSLKSYSGHSLSSARLEWKYDSWGSPWKESGAESAWNPVEVDSDGRFDISFMADSSLEAKAYISLTFKATDATGETMEWDRMVVINPTLSMSMSLTNKADGSLKLSSDVETRFGSGYADSEIVDGNEILADVSAVAGWTFELKPDDVVTDYTLELLVPSDKASPGEADSDGQSPDDAAGAGGSDKASPGGKYCFRPVCSGKAEDGKIRIDITDCPAGLYLLRARTTYTSPDGKSISAEEATYLLCNALAATAAAQDLSSTSCICGVDFFVQKVGDGNISMLIGTTGERWLSLETFGEGRRRLSSEILHLSGISAISRDYHESYPDAVSLNIFSFRDYSYSSATLSYERPQPVEEVFPLEFIVFQDSMEPDEEGLIAFRTDPRAECAVTVYDISSDRIMPNVWSLPQPMEPSLETVYVSASPGSSWSRNPRSRRLHYLGSYSLSKARGAAPEMNDMMAEESYDMISGAAGLEDFADRMPVDIREDFASTLAFIPFLRTDADGRAEFSLRTSDKLSTYRVQVFSHGRDMRGAVTSKDLIVSRVVKVAVAAPQFLYDSDLYIPAISVSNSSDSAIDGTLSLKIFDTKDFRYVNPIASYSSGLRVEAGGTASASFPIDIPLPSDTLGLLAVFTPDTPSAAGAPSAADAGSVSAAGTPSAAGSPAVQGDAVFVTVPVLPSAQRILEAHSALLTAGADSEALKESLRSLFVNPLDKEPDYKEITLREMIETAIPEKVVPEGNDVISLAEAWCSRALSGRISRREPTRLVVPVSQREPTRPRVPVSRRGAELSAEDLLGKVLDCQNADGGFGWFEGFPSSPVITAVVLSYFSAIRDCGLFLTAADGAGSALSAAADTGSASSAAAGTDPDLSGISAEVERAVRYLDDYYFVSSGWPRGGSITLEQYLSIRTAFPEVRFNPSRGGMTQMEFNERYRKFTKDVSEWIVPGRKDRGMQGYILGKARRTAVAMALAAPEGRQLAKDLRLRVSPQRLLKSVDADIASLKQYAVQHPSGGCYYPNAVMPLRGLLESEAYAHSYLCNLLSRYGGQDCLSLADGIRLWLMVQKETQKWDEDPAFVNAILSVLDGSDEVLSARVAVMTAASEIPFGQIMASGNGFRIEREVFRQSAGPDGKMKMEKLSEGDSLRVGERIEFRYKVWSGENRSFVRISLPTNAALRPVSQLSGLCNSGFRLFDAPSGMAHPVYGSSVYRDVKASGVMYYVDVYPEEESVFTEACYVVSAGTFSTPVAQVECLYSPHYRANAASVGEMQVR